MGIDKNAVLSPKAQIKYLTRLIGKILKILYLMEEEDTTKVSPLDYIKGQLLELNSANDLFEGDLVGLIVKLNIIFTNYGELTYKEKRRQILEMKNQINYLIDSKRQI